MSKYNNKKVVIDGIKFDSQKEGRRYLELKLLVSDGHIKDLKLQPRYDFELNGVKMGFYKADFSYKVRLYKYTYRDIVEDVKGFKTPVYNLKKKMMLAHYNIEILET